MRVAKLFKSVLAGILASAAVLVFAGGTLSYAADDAVIDFGAVVKALDFEDRCYVIGHKSPDTDTVCSAIICAELYRRAWGVNCIPAVSGAINKETRYVLDHFGVPVPERLTDASGRKIILVDHSTYSQAIKGMENATVLALYDHHGLGDVRTSAPLIISYMPVGSTGTVLYTVYLQNRIPIDRTIAGLILSCILSDTLNLSLTITTDLDRAAVKRLSAIAGINDVEAYYAGMQHAAESYAGMTDDEILLSDYKEYDMSGTRVAVACVNAADARAAGDLADRMQNAMAKHFGTRGRMHAYVLIRNRTANETTMLHYGYGAGKILEQAFGDAGHVFRPAASRKKDVIPPLEAAYKTMGGK